MVIKKVKLGTSFYQYKGIDLYLSGDVSLSKDRIGVHYTDKHFFILPERLQENGCSTSSKYGVSENTAKQLEP